MTPLMKKIFVVPIALIVLYLITCILLYSFQNKLIFFPKKLPANAHNFDNDSTIQVLQVKISDSKYLRGWLCKNSFKAKQNVIIYFGGNGDELSSFIPQAKQIKGWSVVLLNYAGYGDSDGQPSEKEFFTSALKIYDYIVSRNDVDKNNVVIMGRSIGTGVATFLASSRPSRGVILISPFENLSSVAKDYFGFLPVDLIIKDKFESEIYAQNVKSPLLCIYGLKDRTVRPIHSKALIKSWRGKTEYREFVGLNHDNLIYSEVLVKNINEFLLTLR
jgi:pimeloyl-ACP methyl ester carboxylesterase